MYDSILYPTDGSEAAEVALQHAHRQAEQYGATVHVLYVVDTEQAGVGLASDPGSQHSAGMVGTPEGGEQGMVGSRQRGHQLDDEVEKRATELVEGVTAQFEGVETETAVRVGIPHETILEYADEEGIDMIVMSTHGRSGLDRYLIGSVTEKVVRFSDVPVLTVRALDGDEGA